MRVGGRAGDVVAVGGGQVLQLLQGLDLLGVLLAVARPVLGEGLVGVAILVLLLLGDEVINTVEGHAAVVTDDAATAVGIRQAGDDVGGTSSANTRGVDIEDRVVVGLAVLGEDLLHLGVVLHAGLVDGRLDHTPAAVRHHRALEGGVGLQADDHVIVLADVARLEGVDVSGGVRVDVEDAHLALFGEVLLFESVPHAQGLLGRPCQERGVALVGGVVQLDEITNVDFIAPVTLYETFPGLLVCCRHSSSSRMSVSRCGDGMSGAKAPMCVGFQRLGPLSYGLGGLHNPYRPTVYVLRLRIWAQSLCRSNCGTKVLKRGEGL